MNEGAHYFDPTPEQVRWLWAHMTRKYGSTVVDKSGSIPMQLAGWGLEKMGVMDAPTFLGDYTTTVGKTIYVPFEIGVPRSAADLYSQVIIAVHEHMHVIQFSREGTWTFASRYLLSKSARALYEAEAYRCDMEMEYWRSASMPSPRELAQKLQHYACSPLDIEVATKYLTASAQTIQWGGMVSEPSKEAIRWLQENAVSPWPTSKEPVA